MAKPLLAQGRRTAKMGEGFVSAVVMQFRARDLHEGQMLICKSI